MSIEQYRRVMNEWHAATGMPPSGDDRELNVEIAGATVGLLYDPDVDDGTLHVVADLDLAANDMLGKRMLTLNLSFDPRDEGVFALHPQTGDPILRLDIALSAQLDGTTLPARIAAAIDAARARALA